MQILNDGIYTEISELAIPNTLEDYKLWKKNIINDSYNTYLANGFKSSATGIEYTFGYNDSDKMKFLQLSIDIFNGNTLFPVPVPSIDSVIVMHDQAQYQQLTRDISSFAWSAQTKLHILQGTVDMCGTIEEINTIDCSVSAFDNYSQVIDNSDSKSISQVVEEQKLEIAMLQGQLSEQNQTISNFMDYIFTSFPEIS